jgi:hypothetical protein
VVSEDDDEDTLSNDLVALGRWSLMAEPDGKLLGGVIVCRTSNTGTWIDSDCN